MSLGKQYAELLGDPDATYEQYLAIPGICPECGHIPLRAIPDGYFVVMVYIHRDGERANGPVQIGDKLAPTGYQTTGERDHNSRVCLVYPLGGDCDRIASNQMVRSYGPNVTNEFLNAIERGDSGDYLIGGTI